MPGDTLIITSRGDSLDLPDSLFHQQLASFPGKTGPDDGVMFFVVMAGFVIIIAGFFIIKRIREGYLRQRAYKLAQASLQVNFTQYDEWLAVYMRIIKACLLLCGSGSWKEW